MRSLILNKKMKTLGILGGVGPQTTSEVYLSVIDLVRKSSAEKYPPIVIYNLPFPFIIEDEVIIQGKNSEKMLPYLIEGAKILEKSGASFGILPCNTLHKYIDNIRESVKMPFLSILDEVAKKTSSMRVKKVGVLATQSTVNSNLYKSVLEENRIEIIYPSELDQKVLNLTIVSLLKGEKNNQCGEKIKKICENLIGKGAECILLACTDLQLILSSIKLSVPILDTTEVLIEASVREILVDTFLGKMSAKKPILQG